jgi:acyl-CoA thioesterase I
MISYRGYERHVWSVDSMMAGNAFRRGGVAILVLLAGCRDEPAERRVEPARDSAVAVQPAPGGTPTIVFLGTSITAGLGLDPQQAYPAVIQRKLDSAGYPAV